VSVPPSAPRARDVEIAVVNLQRRHRVERRRLLGFLRRLIDAQPPGPVDSVALSLVSDRRMRAYHRAFRGSDTTTDVLSFLGEPTAVPRGERHLGDIVVSVPTAARQAAARGHRLERELRVLVLHGYLHLLGYDHETDGGTMLRLERRLRRRLLGSRGAR
jgi:probable rRNA maturation factor